MNQNNKAVVVEEIKVLTPKDKDYKRINKLYEDECKKDNQNNKVEKRRRIK